MFGIGGLYTQLTINVFPLGGNDFDKDGFKRSYARLRHLLKIHQASLVRHLLKLSLPWCCFHVGILLIWTALGIGLW